MLEQFGSDVHEKGRPQKSSFPSLVTRSLGATNASRVGGPPNNTSSISHRLRENESHSGTVEGPGPGPSHSRGRAPPQLPNSARWPVFGPWQPQTTAFFSVHSPGGRTRTPAAGGSRGSSPLWSDPWTTGGVERRLSSPVASRHPASHRHSRHPARRHSVTGTPECYQPDQHQFLNFVLKLKFRYKIFQENFQLIPNPTQ